MNEPWLANPIYSPNGELDGNYLSSDIEAERKEWRKKLAAASECVRKLQKRLGDEGVRTCIDHESFEIKQGGA